MELVITLMILLLVVSAIAIHLTQSNNTPFPYKKKIQLFSNSERAFMLMLERAVGDEFRILHRVRLTDLLEVRQGTNKRTAQTAKLKASGKVLDFVLLNKTDLSPIAAIDLVNAEGYKQRPDWFLKGSLDTAGLPHVRIKIKSGYTPAEIRQCIAAKLGPNSKLSPLNVKKVKSKGPTRPIRPLLQAHINQATAQEAQAAA
ncbi:DUF2726 domain-containing protein [Catenovulum sp. SM1970]|uniref:DUF2726 domain-containing protein n=1 Tax=Marinifaba aquimaris TaxID=2741323 RepID=UPI001572C744|nr:DUF2726 domain-containing protein [Marinifaba aquimaris]NTS75612.1 DUF2726 domain-containing protein [Marinifaba aquimaris]